MFNAKPEETILRPMVAGRFYPADENTLQQEVRQYIDNADIEPSGDDIFAILTPHAGYPFSGPVAGYSFKYAQNQKPDAILVLALAHQGVEGGGVFDGEAYETPLGSISVAKDLVKALLQEGESLHAELDSYRSEHSVEVNLPFIQTTFPDTPVASVLISKTDPELCKQLGASVARAIKSVAPKKVLVVVSSDLSHYPPYPIANSVDQEILQSISEINSVKLYQDLQRLTQKPVDNLHCVMCGSAAMLTTVEAAQAIGAQESKVLHYANSGDSPYGEKNRVVGYGSLAIFSPCNDTDEEENQPKEQESELSDVAKRELLLIARKSMYADLAKKPYAPTSSQPALQNCRGVFVTLKKEKLLRGCLGRFDAKEIPLYELVSIMAVETANRDHRFSPVKLDELPRIDIQISVLSPLQRVTDIEQIEIGKHGLQIQEGAAFGLRAGTLLPQVATEQGWDRIQFLQATCKKAGMKEDAWKDPHVEIYKYSADIFGDLDFGHPPFEMDLEWNEERT